MYGFIHVEFAQRLEYFLNLKSPSCENVATEKLSFFNLKSFLLGNKFKIIDKFENKRIVRTKNTHTPFTLICLFFFIQFRLPFVLSLSLNIYPNFQSLDLNLSATWTIMAPA